MCKTQRVLTAWCCVTSIYICCKTSFNAGDCLARYTKYLNVRIDEIVDRAIEKLAVKWGIKQAYMKNPKKRRGYKSEVVRMAIVYAYLVDVLKIDPREAPDRAVEFLARIE